MRLAGNGQRSCRGSGPGARRPITADLLRSRRVAKRAIKAQTTIRALYLGSFWPMNGCPAMTLPPVSPELAARLANYNIDDRARAVLQELAPVLDPHLVRRSTRSSRGAARLQRSPRSIRSIGRVWASRSGIPGVARAVGPHYLDRVGSSDDDRESTWLQKPRAHKFGRRGLDRNRGPRPRQEGSASCGRARSCRFSSSISPTDLDGRSPGSQPRAGGFR